MESAGKFLLKNGLIWGLSLFILACSEKDNDGIEPEIATEEEYVITDPFYADLDNETSLEAYWELFKRDGIRYFNCED